MNNYVVVDLEMCRIPRTASKETFSGASELIQIGAVLIDNNYQVKGTFMTYVSPQFGKIDSFIQRLTGITNEQTKCAPSAKDALEAFANWIPDDACLVAWSDNDRAQIRKEISGKKLSIPRLDAYMDVEHWIDCQALFADKLDTRKKYRLSEALVLAEIEYKDGAHDALVDALNTARLFEKVQREEIFTLSPYLIRADMCDSYTFNPFKKVATCTAC